MLACALTHLLPSSFKLGGDASGHSSRRRHLIGRNTDGDGVCVGDDSDTESTFSSLWRQSSPAAHLMSFERDRISLWTWNICEHSCEGGQDIRIHEFDDGLDWRPLARRVEDRCLACDRHEPEEEFGKERVLDDAQSLPVRV